MEPVDVYFNLHRRVWSLRSRRTGLVIEHRRVVHFALGAKMVVRPSGRERVLRTGKKDVHAFVRGTPTDLSDSVAEWLEFGRSLPGAAQITYNPHRAAHFTRRDTEERIDEAGAVLMVAAPAARPEVWAVPA